MSKAEIPSMWHAYTILWYPCVSDTPITFLHIFLVKVCLDTRIGQLNPEFFDRIIKFWIQPSVLLHTQSHIDFLQSPLYISIFRRIRIRCMESRLKTEIPYMRHCNSICDIAVSICFGCPSHFVTYFSWESLSGHSNRIVESRILQPGS